MDASVVVAVVDDGPDGRWAETLVAGGGLVAPHLATLDRRLSRAPGTACRFLVPPD